MKDLAPCDVGGLAQDDTELLDVFIGMTLVVVERSVSQIENLVMSNFKMTPENQKMVRSLHSRLENIINTEILEPND